jgi:hypothetical protein
MAAFPIPNFNNDFSFSIDISGSPALTPTLGGTYFAFSGKGQNSELNLSSYLTYYSIFVGFLNKDGSLGWIQQSVQASGDCYSPSLALGNNNDLYLAFVTTGAIQSYTNGSSFPPAPGALPPYGNADIVLSRINTVTKTVVWAIQGAGLNGPSNETVPKIAVDTTYGWVYLAYQSSGNIAPFNTIGKTNIILSCFNTIVSTPPGLSIWTTGAYNGRVDSINCTGYNKNPSITTDNAGSVYLAYEVTAQAPNGAPVQQQQIEVVKFSSVNINTPTNPYYIGQYQWTLSTKGVTLFASNGMSSQPNISYFNTTLFISFLTSGIVPGATQSISNDVVIAAVRTNGTLSWVMQGLTNCCPQKYYDVYSVSSCIDEHGKPYVVAVVRKFGSRDSVLVWKLNPENGSAIWTYGFALTDGKNAVWPSKSYEFTTLSIVANNNIFYLGYTTLDPLPNTQPAGAPAHYVGISGFSQRNYADTMTAYSYITSLASGCKCNDSLCDCNTI